MRAAFLPQRASHGGGTSQCIATQRSNTSCAAALQSSSLPPSSRQCPSASLAWSSQRSWHVGGGSAPRPEQAALKATARITYARIHERGVRYAAFRVAFALYEAARIPQAAARSRSHLRGRLRALHVALGGSARLPG